MLNASAAAPIGPSARFSTLYCRICHLTGQPDSVVRSHRLGDMSCPKLSMTDKMYIQQNQKPQVNAMLADHTLGTAADMYGYDDTGPTDADRDDDSQVSPAITLPLAAQNLTTSVRRTASISQKITAPGCNHIQPVPSHILTVNTKNSQVVHIELDSNATINYVKLTAANALNFKITPNSQLSVLADGVTKLPAVGEINETFFRNNWSVTFKAVVVRTLHTDFIGGTVFLKTNNIMQDFLSNTIIVDNKYRVPSTNPAMVLPITPANFICKITESRTLLPGQILSLTVPFPDTDIVSVEPGMECSDADWPQPQLCTVRNGAVTIQNDNQLPVILGKDVKTLQVRTTETL